MTNKTARWTRAGLIYLTATFLTIGLWATFSTRTFYDNFPGGGHHWVSGGGPYNAHLASDAGVGFLAVGAVLLLSAVWMDRRVVQAALVATILHDLPHLLFHLRHPNELLGSADRALSNGGLGLGVFLGALLLVVVSRTPPLVPDEVSTRHDDTHHPIMQGKG